jgi:hypothetical protein
MNINLNKTWKRLTMGAATLFLGAAALQAQVNITVQVDMNDRVGTFTTVHAPGSWNGFDPAGAIMTDADGDNIYEITFNVAAGVDQIYKFVTDGSYANEETVPADCGQPNGFGTFDRVINASSDTTADAVCFGSCVSCAATVNVDVTFIVNMDNEITSALGAHIAGDMNGFTPTVMDDSDGDDVWEITYNLTAGNVIQYKYLNSNDFADGEVGDSLCGIDNGFGAFDRIFTVPTSDTTIGPVCFNECSDCVTTCDASNAPGNTASAVSPSSVALSWDGLPNSVACQIKAERLIPPGPSPSANIISPESQGFNVPVSILGVNTTWKWQVRCACSTSPVVASPLSDADTFATVSAPRLANTIEAELFPNPATDRITVQAQAQDAGMVNWTVVDLMGRNLLAGQEAVVAGANTFVLDLAGLNGGMYFLQLEQGGSESVRSFTVER